MTTIEQAIKEAVEKGGFDINLEWVTTDDCDNEGQHALAVTCDRSFWQALGNAKGWALKQDSPEHWKLEWHRFIDHLAEGKDAESFFARLLAQ